VSEFELIRTEAANEGASVKRMCRLLEVSRSGYYASVARGVARAWLCACDR
jgi:hypothetical protein